MNNASYNLNHIGEGHSWICLMVTHTRVCVLCVCVYILHTHAGLS